MLEVVVDSLPCYPMHYIAFVELPDRLDILGGGAIESYEAHQQIALGVYALYKETPDASFYVAVADTEHTLNAMCDGLVMETFPAWLRVSRIYFMRDMPMASNDLPQ